MATSVPDVQGIGLLGGTFDPIHNGHLRLGWEALCGLNLQRVIVMPCHIPPHRPRPIASHHRLAMAQAACAPIPEFEVSDWELRQQQPSFSITTLSHLRRKWGSTLPLVFIMGADAFNQFTRWHRWQDILGLSHLCIAQRPGSPPPATGSAEAQLLADLAVDDAEALRDYPAGRIITQPSTTLAISATMLRHDIAAGRDPRFLIPDPVWHYIRQHRLYPPHSQDS